MVVLLIVLVLVVGLATLFNRLVRLRNNTSTAWAQVDVMLERRSNLVPNLIATVTGYAEHERQTLSTVAAARATAVNAHGKPGQAAAESQLSHAISHLFALGEQYPRLKADENFKELQALLVETENAIALARHVYNDTVQTYENAREQFPGNLVAALFKFPERRFFEVDLVSERSTPEVNAQ